MKNKKKADIVLKCDAIFTGLTDAPIKGGVAILDNRIVAVGDNSEIIEWIDEDTKVLIYYGDEMIMPGFNDAHFHLPDSSLFSNKDYCIPLFDCTSVNQCINRIESYIDEHPDMEWIFGVGWNHWLWPGNELPDKTSLDKIQTGKPICLQSFDMHSAWVNSAALDLIGIDRNTPDPEIGWIGKDNDGEPNGMLFDTEAVLFATEPAHKLPEEILKSVFKDFLKTANRFGITTIADVHPRGVARENAYDIYRSLEETGDLSVRLMFFPELKDELSEARWLRDKFTSEKVRFCGLKQLADGVVESHTAYMVDSYTDEPSSRGELLIAEQRLRRQIIQADSEGFSVRVHSIGDGTVRLCLDIFEEANKLNGKKGNRHAIEHIENIQADDITRFAELGVIASMQPVHSVLSTESFKAVVGPERVKRAWALKSIVGTGAAYAIGTDSPVADMDPIPNIYAAVTRTDQDGNPAGGFNPEEKISIADVLRGYTSGSAYLEDMENKIGTLEAGKLADIVVLSKNLFNIPEKEILDTKVKLTIMDGRIVHRGQ